MNRILLAGIVAMVLSTGAFAQQSPGAPDPQQTPHASEPQQTPQAPDPYAELNKRVQQALKDRALYDGPVNGDFGWNTQTALAQFQLSESLPASGMLDEQTMRALGIEPAPAPQASAEQPTDASAGATAQPEQPAQPEQAAQPQQTTQPAQTQPAQTTQ